MAAPTTLLYQMIVAMRAIPAKCSGRFATYVLLVLLALALPLPLPPLTAYHLPLSHQTRQVSRNVLRKVRSLRNGDGTFTSANNVWHYVYTKHGRGGNA